MRITKRLAAAAALLAFGFGAVIGGNIGWPDSRDTTAGDPIGWPDIANTTSGDPIGWPDVAGDNSDA
ncbi:hypothetical protein [Parenemella sanctibonifatiensis]|uniref:Uncharacterized protein n=1 Tax=Parenemella sanctibonifatiensis TaxID=2016505 RepID=A0A255E8B2_9ACTN|nr:hypothetical protein [Parenemella sanctibonifatiensis]OYN87520.1 hypothetical protein CGZ92_07355 [Parenemella sanctibonifatiensis]